MEANELRIGNILKYNTEKMNTMYPEFYWRVTNIGVKSFKCKGHSGINFEPIPLSEEILLKVGFEKHHPEGNLYSLPWILTSLNDGKKIDKNFSVALFEGFYVACQCQNTHLRYFHELQNLFYFTAQGKELNTTGL